MLLALGTGGGRLGLVVVGRSDDEIVAIVFASLHSLCIYGVVTCS